MYHLDFDADITPHGAAFQLFQHVLLVLFVMRLQSVVCHPDDRSFFHLLISTKLFEPSPEPGVHLMPWKYDPKTVFEMDTDRRYGVALEYIEGVRKSFLQVYCMATDGVESEW